MDLNKARTTIVAAFREPLHQRGFRETKRLTFTRGTTERLETISFGLRRAKAGAKSGQYCFGVGVGIRFEAIEAARNRKAGDQELFSTVGMPLHLLSPSRRYREWCFDDATAPSLEALSEIDLYALPFFDKYRTIDDVRSALASQDPMSWFTLSPDQREEVLNALSMIA